MSIDIRDPGKSCYSEGKIKPLNVVSVSKWLEQQLATNIVVNINSTFLGMKFAEVHIALNWRAPSIRVEDFC